MITLKPNETQLEFAKKQSAALPIRNTSYHIVPEGRNYVGFVGEKAVADLIDCDHSPSYEYDLILKDGRTVDCKTFSNKYYPKDNFECHVMKKRKQQSCDIYLFSSYNREKNTLHLCGYMPRDEFYSKAKQIKKGDNSDINNIKYRADGYIIKVGELYPIEDLL
jgi:hypothetical protein